MISQDARLVPITGGVLVIIHQVVVIQATLLPSSGKHSPWLCACGRKLRNDTLLVRHARSFHAMHAYQACGVAAAFIPSMRYVPSHGRRSRMPWRVQADS